MQKEGEVLDVEKESPLRKLLWRVLVHTEVSQDQLSHTTSTIEPTKNTIEPRPIEIHCEGLSHTKNTIEPYQAP